MKPPAELNAANSNDAPARRDGQGGKLAENIMHFARVLREAGLPVGPGQVLDALEAAECGCLRSRDDFYWMLHAVLVRRRRHRVIFDQAFHVFWQKPKMLEQMMSMFFQQVSRPADEPKKKPGQRRLASAMFDGPDIQSKREAPPNVVEVDASYTFNADEVLRQKDFEQMSASEQVDVLRAIAKMRLGHIEVPTRRFASASRGRIDMRRTLKAAARSGAGMASFKFRRQRTKEPPLVVLCDISGSMSGYSRMFLHLLHAIMSDRSRTHVFLFGTRLTNVTRSLQRRDPDEAIELVSAQVKDWSGGTRIGHCLREFNYDWSRRVLTQGAHVLLITDGLDRDDDGVLEREMARLARSAKRIVWLNPLLRFDRFEPKAKGIRTMLDYVDEFRPIHNLECLEDLAVTLTNSRGEDVNPRRWQASGAEMEWAS